MDALIVRVAARFREKTADFAQIAMKVAARFKKKTISDKGNPVYLYSERQIQHRNRKKAERLEKLSKNIDKLRSQVKSDLKSSDPEKLLTALAVALIDETYERVGNPESADDGHFGVTGWQKSHVSFAKGKATIKYVGKSGVKHKKTVADKTVVKALRDAYEGCTDDCLFQHDGGKVDAGKVNAYLEKFDISAKDLRGFHANTLMQEHLRAARKGSLPEDKKEREKQLKSEFKKALEETAEAVGHEPSTLKSQYLVPGLEEKFLADGTVMDRFKEASLVERVASEYVRVIEAAKIGPEAPETAPFGRWAWASHRSGLPNEPEESEPDTELERTVFLQIRKHFASDREGLPKDTAELLASCVEQGWYQPVLHPPPYATLYRGLRITQADVLAKLVGDGAPPEGALDFEEPKPLFMVDKDGNPDNGYSSSWTAQKKITRDFSGDGKRGWAVTLFADTAANPNRFLAGPGGLYNVNGLSRWHLEKETVGLEPILVRRIEWSPLGDVKTASGAHYIERCARCSTVISRCRCKGPHEERLGSPQDCPNCNPLPEVRMAQRIAGAPSQAQIDYARRLIQQVGGEEPDWTKLDSVEMSKLIDGLKQKRGKPVFYGNGQFSHWEKKTAHMDKLARRVASRYAATQRLDLAWVEGLRKDFLTLMKNIPRIKDYKTAHEIRDALRIYRTRFKELFFEHFLDNTLKYELDLSEGDAKWLDKKLRPLAWSFTSELMNMPIGFVDQYNTEPILFERFEQEAPKWKARLQKRAQEFWKEMKDTIDWFEKVRKKPIDVKVPTVENATVEGFKLVMRSYDDSDEYHQKELELLREGLKHYRQRASAVAPILLRKQLPVIVEFKSTLDQGGEYNGNGTISIYASSFLNKGFVWVAHVMAHEMGHHLFKSALSGEAREFWTQTIKGDFGDLDLKELLRKWPDDTWAFQFTEKMGQDDPILALQVDAVSHDRSYGELQTKEDFQKLLDSGKQTIRVPKHPITGYANKNPEEAFCEAIGLLVANGPQAVHPKVRWWLDTALPGAVKLATNLSIEPTLRGATSTRR